MVPGLQRCMYYLSALERTLDALGPCPLPREMQSNAGLGSVVCFSAIEKKEDVGSVPGDNTTRRGRLQLQLDSTVSREGGAKSRYSVPSTLRTTSCANAASCRKETDVGVRGLGLEI